MLSTETVFKGKIFDITVDRVELEDGNEARRDVLLHSGGVCVVPVTDSGNVVLVRQFRYPFGEVTAEVPAGKLERGEDSALCGRRELLEETGYECSELIFLGEFYPTPAYNTEITYMYMAKGLSHKTQSLDEGEFLDVIELSLEEAVKMIMHNEIKDGKTQTALLKAAYLNARDRGGGF